MTKLLRQRFVEAAKRALNECGDNSKEMIANNIASFEEMGMNDALPGQFSPEEITDKANLENTAKMSNDTNFNSDECSNPLEDIKKAMEDMTSGLIDISVSEDEPKPFEHPHEDEEEHHHHEHHDEEKRNPFAESALLQELKKQLKESNLLESDYAAPLRYVPDTRINTSDVLNALKAKIGEGSEAIHVDSTVANNGDKIYTVSQIEKSKLPNELDVENVTLKLGDEGYTIEKAASEFPVKKD